MHRTWNLGMATLLAAIALAGSANAAEPTLVGSYKDWFVYQVGTGADRNCYALTQPKQTDPKTIKRDPAFFLISTWPARKVNDEPSMVPGFQYKEDAKVQAQVGSDKFDFFVKNDGTSGGAWVKAEADEKRMIDAMKRGSMLSITGVSSRGTLVKDNFSLSGLSAALDKIDQTCK